jgi:hypothetical protein
MKRKFSDRANWRRILKKNYACFPMDDPQFRGFVTLYRIQELRDPLWKEYNGRRMCLADKGYLWMQHFPKGEHFVVTTMFDPAGNVVQWYIDICKTQGLTDQQVPWFDDLYLDIVTLPTGEVLLLDEDELEEALDDGVITQKDSDLAQRTANRLLEWIRSKTFPYFDMSIRHRKLLLDKLGWEKGTSFG